MESTALPAVPLERRPSAYAPAVPTPLPPRSPVPMKSRGSPAAPTLAAYHRRAAAQALPSDLPPQNWSTAYLAGGRGEGEQRQEGNAERRLMRSRRLSTRPSAETGRPAPCHRPTCGDPRPDRSRRSVRRCAGSPPARSGAGRQPGGVGWRTAPWLARGGTPAPRPCGPSCHIAPLKPTPTERPHTAAHLVVAARHILNALRG